jgi:hypothetical protein
MCKILFYLSSDRHLNITIPGTSDEILFEGDMIMPVEEVERAIRGEDLDAPGRARGARRSGLWPNAVVPYVFSRSVSKCKYTTFIPAGFNPHHTHFNPLP